jgi:hypothetical protein
MIEQAIYLAEAMGRHDATWKHGATAKFALVNPLWGVKFYRARRDREYCHRLQAKAAEHGLAPPIGEKLTADLDDAFGRQVYYGFLTMAADMSTKQSRKQQRILVDNLEEIGIINTDITGRVRTPNSGWFDDVLVCIDFDIARERNALL